MGAVESPWQSFLLSRHAVWLTHGTATILAIALIALLLYVPFWIAAVPGVLLAHRIGVMMHEYIHGIPFRKYSHNLVVLSIVDGLTLMFGTLELFRGTHLSHHRWLNTPNDSGFTDLPVRQYSNRLVATIMALEITFYLRCYFGAWNSRHPYIRSHRLAIGVGLSLATIAFWIAVGRGDVAWKLMAITAFTTAVPVSLRGAIEHHSEPENHGFANEYRVLIPLFNLNRHVHHHEDSRLPWYRLEWRTPQPLHWRHYFLYWFRLYVKRDLVLMHPIEKRPKPTNFPT
jgi:fatty acid desaturase